MSNCACLGFSTNPNCLVHGDGSSPQKWRDMKASLLEMNTKYSQMKSQLALAQKKIEVLKACAEFYGDIGSWVTFTEAYSEYEHESHVICAHDCVSENDVEVIGEDIEVGGKRARECLKQIEAMGSV